MNISGMKGSKPNIGRFVLLWLPMMLMLAVAPAALAQVELELWTPFGSGRPGEAMEDLVARFNETHSDIVVTHLPVPSDIAGKYHVSLAAGVSPNIGWVAPDWFYSLYTEAYVVPVEFYVERYGIDEAQFFPGVWRQGVDNRQWGIPFEVGSEALIYNQDWFDRAGISEAPTTWDDFLAVATRLTDPEAGMHAFQPSWAPHMTVQWVWRNGGDILSSDHERATFDQPETVEAVRWLAELETRYDAVGGRMREATAAMNLASPGSYESSKTYPFTFGTGPAPVPESGTRASLSYYKELLIFKSTPEQEDASWTFIEWLIAPEQQVEWAMKTGYLPVTRFALDTDEYRQYLAENPRLIPWIDELEYSRNFPSTSYWPHILGLFEQALHRAREGESAENAMIAMQEVAQGYLDQERSRDQ